MSTPSAPHAELPKATNAHQLWVDILIQEQKKILYPKSLESKDGYKIMSSKKSLADRCNKALQLAVDFENLRLKIVSNKLADAHQVAYDKLKALHAQHEALRWWQWKQRRMLDRMIEIAITEEYALNVSFGILVNTPPPAPPQEGKTEEEMDAEIDQLVKEHEARQLVEKAKSGDMKAAEKVLRLTHDKVAERITFGNQIIQEPPMDKAHPCDQCGGTGYAGPSFTEEKLCEQCKGSGQEPTCKPEGLIVTSSAGLKNASS